MAEQQRELGGSGPQSASEVLQRINAVLPGHQLVYDREGNYAIVREEDKARWEYEHGLLPEPHDVAGAAQELAAHYQALGEALRANLEEIAALGWVRPEAETVLQAAVHELLDRWRWYVRSVGGTLATESVVRSVAEHKALHGSLDLVPTLRRYEPLADEYARRQPVDVEDVRARAAASQRQAIGALLERAAAMAADDPQQAEELRQKAQQFGGTA